MAMQPGELQMVAPKKGMPPVHLVDLDLKARKEKFKELGIAAFRADQVSRHWFSRLSDDPTEWSDINDADRDKINDELLPHFGFSCIH